MEQSASTRVDIEVVASGLVNYAMAHNRMPFLKRIGLVFPGAREPIAEVRVAARVQAPDGGVLSRPWQTTLTEVDPSRPISLDSPQLWLDPAQISTLEEELTAEIVVEVSLPGAEPVLSYTPLRVLAARQWLIDPASPLVSLELLSAFVQPNHAEIEFLVSGLGDRLMKSTKDASLAVQHVSPQRVDAIVQAVCEAVHDRDISYAEPPASWGYGQKVRDAGAVLGQRLGTCLDTTLLLASVLEHLGISPVLWLAQGHAFLGWWRQPALTLPEAASLQVTSAINAVDLELVGVLETTMLTRQRRPPRDIVRRARQQPLDTYFRGAADQLVGVVDVAMARTMGVLPMPVRRVRADGVVEVVEYHAAGPASPAVGEAPAPTAGAVPREQRPVPARIQSWKQSLLDLTLRNPLLNLGRGMTQLPLLVPHAGMVPLSAMVQDGRPVSLRAADDLSWAVLDSSVGGVGALPGEVQRSLLSSHRVLFSAAPGEQHRQLVQRLRYRARTARQETGANLLTLTLGRLDWQLGERSLSAPLLLAPVELKGIVPPFKIALDPAGEITLNHSLLEKLRVECGLTVPELAELPRTSAGQVDVEAVLQAVRRAIATAGLAFRVDEDARLAIIAFTGYLLWRDLDEHWETFLERPLVRHLAFTPAEDFADPAGVIPDDATAEAGRDDLDALTAAAPIPADGSQIAAVAAARAGQSFVLEGPPGTGKSQTITNIIADQMAQGRTVLFVAEKGAALDVVRRRLAGVGLLPFALDLHDDNARPAGVRQQLKTALALRPHPDQDAYRVQAADVASTAATLADYARRLHAANEAGLSLYSAHGLRLARGDGATLPVPPAAAGLADAVRRAAPELALLGENVWQAWGFARHAAQDPSGWQRCLERADREAAALAGPAAAADVVGTDPVGHDPVGSDLVGAALAAAQTPHDLASVLELLRADVPPPAVLDEIGTPRWLAARDELEQRTAAFRESSAPLWEVLAPAALSVPLDPVRQGLREAAASFFIGRKGRLVRAAEPVLTQLRPGARVQPAELPALVEQLASAAQRHAALVSAWRALPGLAVLPADLNLADPGTTPAIAQALESVGGWASRFANLAPGPQTAVRATRAAHPGGIDAGRYATGHRLVQSLTEVFAQVGADDADVLGWLGERRLLPAWLSSSAARADDQPRLAQLARWCDAAVALEPLRTTAPQARWALLTVQVPAADAVAALERGLAVASEQERLDTEGLRLFDPASQDRAVQRFVAAAADLRGTLRAVLPTAVVERRPFTPGRLFGKVGSLEREIGRSRGGLSVRQLIQQYGEVIAEVTPCVLVSPDSLARFIPPGAMPFDLVVFDEASQITVADAVGALGRAQAAVIAGDSKQMPPTMFAALGSDADAEDSTAEFATVQDEESILSEAVLGGVPRLWLTWHYRSRDESLIAFSNGRYYDGRLLTFPTAPGRQQDVGLSFTRVQGTFIRSSTSSAGALRTNPAEAAAVVGEVLRRWRTGERSVGVVTFNIQQRTLIETMLVDADEPGLAESLLSRHDGVFVKNLENVQGDERDVIIFSTGFSAAENGVLPLNFGPLNRQGGQRRLNVAVTRARRRVMMFCSFEPEDLRADQTSSVGVKDLRAYLELAKYGAAAVTSTEPGAGLDRHREAVAEGLRARGFDVRTALGLSEFQVDLAVARAGEPPCLAVLLDTPAWSRRRTTSDRDALPLTVLGEVMGWPGVARVWLPAWLTDPEAVLDRLAAAAEEAATRPLRRGEDVVTFATGGSDPPLTTEGDAAEDEVPDGADMEPRRAAGSDEPGASEPLSDLPTSGSDGVDRHRSGPESPDVPADPDHAIAIPVRRHPDLGDGSAADPDQQAGRSDPVGLHSARVDRVSAFVAFEPVDHGAPAKLDRAGHSLREKGQTQDLIRQIVEVEGPVSPMRLARLVVRCHRLTRVTDARFHQLTALFPTDLRRDDLDGFFWPSERDPLRWNGYRSSTSLKDRPLDDIATLEIANAATDIARTAMGIDLEDLLRETIRIFGGSRVTATTRDRLLAAVRFAIDDGRLQLLADVITPRG